jgi:hypothetical protein
MAPVREGDHAKVITPAEDDHATTMIIFAPA